MIKNRYGVVNPNKRKNYEKKWHVPYGYDFISFNKKEAVGKCGDDQVVERITTSFDKLNKTTVIYRPSDMGYPEGKFDDVGKENRKEKDK